MKPRVAIAYVRVSTEEQACEGVSLEAQQARIRAYCVHRELDLLDVIIDAGVSAGKPLDARDGGKRLLDALASGAATDVVSVKLDRLFRNVADCLTVVESWDKANIAMHLVDMGGQAVDTSSAIGRFFLTITAAMAELERTQTCERTRVALRHKRAQGEYCGGRVPYGYVLVDGKLEVHGPEQAIVLTLCTWSESTLGSHTAMARELTSLGYRTRSGATFQARDVARILAFVNRPTPQADRSGTVAVGYQPHLRHCT